MSRTLAQLRRVPEPPTAHTQAIQQVQQARQAERLARNEQIMALHQQGMKSGEIASVLSMSQRTLQRWMATGTIPYSRRKNPRPRLIDPYKSYLLKRGPQGCQSGAQLARELKDKGYAGSHHSIYRYLETLKVLAPVPSRSKCASKRASADLPSVLLMLSASQATWLFFRRQEDLKPEELEILRQLRQASPSLEATYQLVEEFLSMVRKRTGEHLDEWLNKVEASHLQAFRAFVTGVQKDNEAILAGLTLPWSNGPLEGHVNRFKLMKRRLYGRAAFDLLRRRVLWTPQRKRQGVCKPESKLGAFAEERAV
jgi:transposase